jgi:multiple sugar transport system substrate-binding protein
MPEQQQRPKMVMELASGRPSFDVTHYSLHVSKRVIGSGQWLVDMRPYLADNTLTAPDYDWADMSPGALRAASTACRSRPTSGCSTTIASSWAIVA